MPRGYIGIGGQPVGLPDSLRTSLSITGKSGIMVVQTEPGGPAEHAGILLGDILVGIGDATLEDIDDLRSFSDSGMIGKPVKARVIRAGTLREVEIVVGERPGK